MSTVEIPERITEAPPLLKAGIGGACWLMTILAGIFGMYVANTLIVSGDAAASATNTLANEAFFRTGAGATLVSTGSYV